MARLKSTRPKRHSPSPWNRPSSAISLASAWNARFKVDADQLTITPADPKEGWRVTYERL